MSARSSKRLLDDQDELEYNITFPTTTDANEEGVKEPVVYLLGWASASDKHLAKYSALYEREDCITIRYIHPEDELFLISSTTLSTFEATAEKLCQLLEDYDLKENPIIIHSFSNNGACVYRYLADIFLREKINVVGSIFDSAPSPLDLSTGIRAIYLSQRPKGMMAFLTYVGRFLWCSSSFILTGLPLTYYKDLEISKTHLWPHLFLYSTNDGVVPTDQILDIAKARRCSGAVSVKTHDFKDSPHVQHLKYHKDEYTEQCISFLDECLQRFDDGEILGGVSRPRSSSVDPTTTVSASETRPSTSTSRRSSARVRNISQSETRV